MESDTKIKERLKIQMWIYYNDNKRSRQILELKILRQNPQLSVKAVENKITIEARKAFYSPFFASNGSFHFPSKSVNSLGSKLAQVTELFPSFSNYKVLLARVLTPRCSKHHFGCCQTVVQIQRTLCALD